MIDRAQLVKALSTAFPDPGDFQELLQGINRNWWNLAGQGDTLEQGIGKVIEKAIAQNWLGDLLTVVERSDARNNPQLRALLDAHWQRNRELAYLKRLLDEIGKKARLYAPLEGIATVQPCPEADPYLEPWEDDATLAILSYEPRDVQRERQEFSDAVDAFQQVKRSALLGAPGAGKSTTLRRLAMNLAERALRDPAEPVPLWLPLGNWRDGRPLAEFIAGQAPEFAGAAPRLLESGRLYPLLDGLNEMPTGLRSGKVGEIRQWMEGLGAGARVVVSCREADYNGELDLGLDTLTLQELKPWRVRKVLHHWVVGGGGTVAEADRLFWQLAGDPGLADVLRTWEAAGSNEEAFWTVADPKEAPLAYQRTTGVEDALWRQHVRDPRSLLRLAANPFLLTMLFQVWRFHQGELPRNRGDVFRRFVDGLLQREGLTEGSAAKRDLRRSERGERLLAGLTQLAWRMQTVRVSRGPEESGDFGVLTVVTGGEALAALGGDEGLLKKAVDGTLLEGEEEVRFLHQLLQEYFTALALRERMAEKKAAEFWPRERWWERSGWEEAALLLAGLFTEDCSAVVRWLAEAQPVVAAECALKSGAAVPEVAMREWKADWLSRMTDVEREPQPQARAALGRVLGRLGLDDRPGVSVREGTPDIDWVRIEGGEFVYQQGERRSVKTFYMARYPVTNSQYDAFLNAPDGYRHDDWWKGFTDPVRTSQRPSWSELNHPRETVSWWEAMAFCGWLSKRLSYEVRLPTEWEWERAARGVDGRAYPWGEEYRSGNANINETWAGAKVGPHYLGRTSAVGIYPQGGSPEGVMDLSGNVLEWCLNEHEKPERTQRSGREPRVLRGGSWDDGQEDARADYRTRWHPVSRFNSAGFRLVCSSPIR